MPEQSSLFPYFDPEDKSIELKSCSGGRLPDDAWKSISAFSNTEGGKLILGVNPQHQPIGLSVEEVDKIERDIVALCRNGFNCPIIPEVQVNGSVVVAYIPPAPAVLRPVYSLSRGISLGAYVRIGSSNILMTDEMRNQFAVAARGGAEIIEYPNTPFQDFLDMELIGLYIKLVNDKRSNAYRHLSVREILLKLKAIKDDDNVTLFGLLAFGKDELPQEVSAPTTNIAVTQYAGDSKVGNDPSQTYLDNREFNGNIIVQFSQALDFIKSKLPISGVVQPGGQRKDYLIVPEIALREALANALAHRDYSTYSSRIQVDIYSDRLEIINPGTSLIPISELESSSSVSRNPLVMSFLKDYGITEQRARGIRTIRQSLRAAGLLEPEFANVGTSFKATIYSSAFISRTDQKWLTQFKEFRLNDRQLTALAHIKNTPGGINNAEYREINNMNEVKDDIRAKKELVKLAELGLLVAAGEKRYRRYFINKSLLKES